MTDHRPFSSSFVQYEEGSMKKLHFSSQIISESVRAVFLIMGTTLLMLLIGRETLGEAVIALIYLVPIAWSANRWGQQASTSAALAAALSFDFFFIPPFYTFAVARLEGWLVLAIFLAVAIVVVGRIQASLSTAHEIVLMYDLCESLTGMRSQDAVARTAARRLQQFFMASLVKVIYRPEKNAPDVVVCEPRDATRTGKPDRQLPILNTWGLIGEIQIWGNHDTSLPVNDSHLFRNFAAQIGRAFERAQLYE
jgi:K+-sensing histidine kinase KdpD